MNTSNNDLKITFFGTYPPLKNVSPYCYHLLEPMSKKVNVTMIGFRNIAPHIVYHGGFSDEKVPKKIEAENFSVYNVIKWYNPFSWIKAGLMSKGQIVHIQHWVVYSSLVYLFILPILKIRGKKILISIHNVTPHTVGKISRFLEILLNKIIFNFAQSYIVHNQRNKESFIKTYNKSEENIYIVTHGILKPYSKIKGITKNQARKTLGLLSDKKIILNFGYMWEYKGLDLLLDSMVKIKNKIPNVQLLLAGQPLKNWEKYEKIIHDKDLENFVMRKLVFIPDPEIEYYFASADLVVLPYRPKSFDTHGGVGALSLSFGKPMVVTNVGGLPEFVKDKQVIVKPEDSNELAETVIKVLNDEKLLQKLSNDSKQLFNELNWDVLSDKTIQIYKNMINQSE